MKKLTCNLINKGLFTLLFIAACLNGLSQPLFTPWGNVNGIYIEGEKMEFESSIRAVDPDWKGYVQTEKYNWEGNQTYTVEGKTHTVSHELLSMPVAFTVKMTETATHSAGIALSVIAKENVPLAGLFYCFEVPGKEFSGGTVQFFVKGAKKGELSLASLEKNEKGDPVSFRADKIVVKSENREYEVFAGKVTEIILRHDFISQPAYLNDPSPRQLFVNNDPNLSIANFQFYFALKKGSLKRGDKIETGFAIKAAGKTDKEPAFAVLDASRPGRKFDGIGGNFRLQFPDKDPAVIDFCLENLDVTWARVPFYWNEWQPDEHMDPLKNALEGKLSEKFKKQMELAVRLAKLNMPVIFSIWAPPAWAVDQNKKVPKGVILDNKKIETICKSITSFFEYTKHVYGLEADYFSFNEADYGVEVFQTKEDHAFQLRAIGKHLASAGLITKVLIGDTGAGTAKANKIMAEIEKDPELHQYAGAVSFHTYHGVTTPDLEAWARSAKNTNLPVMVAEGGSNSAAHRYPLVFLQPWFQLDEVDKYIRIMSICQPVTIMEWQLTADYSVLTGMGMYGDNGPLRPTQRFWNLKQLGLAPKGSFALPLTCDRPNISCAAYGHIMNNVYTFHFVNNGTSREVKLSGIPAGVNRLHLYVTDASRGMEKVKTINVAKGEASFMLESQTFTTLSNK